MSITTYQGNINLNREFGASASAIATPLYVGLSTTAVDVSGAKTEPAVGSYARVAIDNNKTTWGAAALGILVNVINIQFIESTASWGTITDVFIADALSGGNILYFESLTVNRTVADATTVLFAANTGMTIKMNNT